MILSPPLDQARLTKFFQNGLAASRDSRTRSISSSIWAKASSSWIASFSPILGQFEKRRFQLRSGCGHGQLGAARCVSTAFFGIAWHLLAMGSPGICWLWDRLALADYLAPTFWLNDGSILVAALVTGAGKSISIFRRLSPGWDGTRDQCACQSHVASQ